MNYRAPQVPPTVCRFKRCVLACIIRVYINQELQAEGYCLGLGRYCIISDTNITADITADIGYQSVDQMVIDPITAVRQCMHN